MSGDRSVLVTVAICTFNRARLLKETLSSLTGLALPVSLSWELLVVDNASTDDTRPVSESFMDRLPLRIVSESTPGLSNARNRALAEARGNWVVFTDDDVLLSTGWLREFAAAVERHPDAAAAGGPIAPWFPVAPPPDLLEAFPILANGFCGVDHRRPEGPLPAHLSVYGANMAFRVACIAGLKFDPRLGYTPTSLRGGEEGQFIQQIRARGGDVLWCPGMRLQHYVDPSRMTLAYLASRQAGYGEEQIRTHGVPAGPSLMGVPRWLLRRTAEAYGGYLGARLSASRVEALKRFRQYCEYRGMVRECRAVAAAARPGNAQRMESQCRKAVVR